MKGKTKATIYYVIVGLIVFLVFFFVAPKLWFLGGAEKDYKIIYLGGHEYYRANFLAKGLLGIRLDEKGKPIKCKTAK